MLCWCPHPILIWIWATTPWLLPFAAATGVCFTVHSGCVAVWDPIHVVVVLCCVRVVCWREGRGRERAIQTQSKAKEGRKSASKRERRLSQNGKREDAHTRAKRNSFHPCFLALLPIKHSKHTTRRRRGRHTGWVDQKEGEQPHGKMDGWDAHCLVSHTNTHCILHWKGEHE